MGEKNVYLGGIFTGSCSVWFSMGLWGMVFFNHLGNLHSYSCWLVSCGLLLFQEDDLCLVIFLATSLPIQSAPKTCFRGSIFFFLEDFLSDLASSIDLGPCYSNHIQNRNPFGRVVYLCNVYEEEMIVCWIVFDCVKVGVIHEKCYGV